MNNSIADLRRPASYRIQGVEHETHDTFTLELKATDEVLPWVFAPGQFNMLYVSGAGEVPLSISSNPACMESIQHTIRIVDPATEAMYNLKPGDPIGVRGPFGNSWPLEIGQGKDVVLIADGIGLAPLRPALFELLAFRKRYHRIVLLYGTRTPRDILFKQDLKSWQSHFDLEVRTSVIRPMAAGRSDIGFIIKQIPLASFDPTNSISLICGPEMMMRCSVEALQQRGVRNKDIFISMQLNLENSLGVRGHCRNAPHFTGKDGPVFRYDRIASISRKGKVFD